jgi:hypothetical protein
MEEAGAAMNLPTSLQAALLALTQSTGTSLVVVDIERDGNLGVVGQPPAEVLVSVSDSRVASGDRRAMAFRSAAARS